MNEPEDKHVKRDGLDWNAAHPQWPECGEMHWEECKHVSPNWAGWGDSWADGLCPHCRNPGDFGTFGY